MCKYPPVLRRGRYTTCLDSMAQVRQGEESAADADSAHVGTRATQLDGIPRQHSPFTGSHRNRTNRSCPPSTGWAAEGFPAGAGGESVADGSAECEYMKVAIAKDGLAVSEHFGHCEGYAVYSIENNSAVRGEDLVNPGHSPGFLPVYLADQGIGAVITGGMGSQAIDLFDANGIEVVLGISGPLDDAARAFAAGALVGSDCICNHDHCNGDCGSH